MAIPNLSVLREGETRGAHRQQRGDEAGSAALKGKRDRRTRSADLGPEHPAAFLAQPGKERNIESKIVGYAVSNAVTVRVRKLGDAAIPTRRWAWAKPTRAWIVFPRTTLPTLTEARRLWPMPSPAKTLAEAADIKLGKDPADRGAIDHAAADAPWRADADGRDRCAGISGEREKYPSYAGQRFEIAP